MWRSGAPSGWRSAPLIVLVAPPVVGLLLSTISSAPVGLTARPMPVSSVAQAPRDPSPPPAREGPSLALPSGPSAGSTPAPPPNAGWTGESSFNFVALGIDWRGEREIPRTDTIIIGNVDLKSPRLSLVSVPRDLLVTIPGYGQDRINSAYVYGEQFKEPDGGVGLLVRTVERNFGISIQHFGMIDFHCFRTTVDALGGVTVEVPRAILDTQYPTDDYRYKTVRFDAGRQRMNGDRALEYARTRNADNDFGRIRRQHQVVVALRQELLQLRALPALPAIVGGCQGMRSDLSLVDYLSLANAVRQFDENAITLRAIDERMAVESYASTGAAVLLPRWEPIRALVRDSFSNGGPAAGMAAAGN